MARVDCISSLRALILLSLTAGISLWAQRGDLRFDHLTTADGLSQGWIYALHQDSTGYIWLGTENGLNRYDGHRFKIYRNNAEDPASLPSSLISAIHEDDQGRLWVATHDGLARKQPNGDRFTVYRTNPNQPNSLVGNDVTAFLGDRRGRLWIATFHGLSLYQPDSDDFKNYEAEEGNPTSLPDARILSLFQDKTGRIWLGTESGLVRFDPDQGIFSLELSSDNEKTLRVNVIRDGIAGALWLGTDQGLIYFRPGEGEGQRYVRENDEDQGLSDNIVRDILVDRFSNLWIATTRGLDYFDTGERRFYHHTYDTARPRGLSQNHCSQLMLDRAGLLWVGTRGDGVNIWNPRTAAIDAYPFDPQNKQGLAGDVIWNFDEDSAGNIWVGGEGGLQRLNRRTNQFQTYPLTTADGDGTRPTEVFSVAVDTQNAVWAGTNSGLLRLNPSDGRVERFQSDPDNPNAISDNTIFSMEVDGLGFLWVGTDLGLNRWDGSRFERYFTDPANDRSLPSNSIRALHQGVSGSFWVGTHTGVARYNAGDNQFDRFYNVPSTAGGFQAVTALTESEPGLLWVGRGGAGLSLYDFRADGNNPTIANVAPEILPNKNIFAVVPDDRGYLWVTTNQGMLRLHPEYQDLRLFDHHDGLNDAEHNEGAALRARDGKIFVGTVRGFNAFYPEDLEPTFPPPPLTISSVRLIDGTELYSDDLVLDWDQRMSLTITFAALDFAKRGKNHYRYRLLGYDNVWRERSDRGEAVYTNLGAGLYTFEITARNSDGVEAEAPVRIRIQIRPPPWRSPAMILVYFLILGLILAIILRMLANRRRLKKQAEAELRASERRLKLALWGSGGFMWDWEAESDESQRTQFEELLGYAQGELPTKIAELRSLVHPGDLFQVEKSWQDHIAGKSPFFEAEYRIRSGDGTWRWIHERGMAADRGPTGKALRMSGTYRDISEMKRTEDKIRLFAKAFENTSEAMMILNTNQVIIAVNNAFCSITGYSSLEIPSQHISVLNSSRHEADFYEHLMDMVQTTDKWEGEFWARRKNGEEFPMWVNMSLLRDSKGLVTNYVAVFSDITERKRAEEELRHLANYDILTGLPNRTLFNDRLNQALRHAHRGDNQLALLFLDLDHFKKINDSFGHAVGDMLLKGIARRLSECLRDEDTLARLGGDEFIVLLDDFEDAQDAAHVAGKLLAAVDRPFTLEGHEVKISMSMGISLYPADGVNAETLLKNADTAMYHSKNEGRGSFQFYKEELNVRAFELLQLENQLRKAIELGQLRLHYQPQFDVRTGTLTGVEALVRWEHPEKGLLGPGQFIPLAEETGVILPLGLWVLNEACRQAAQWRREGYPGIQVAVNLSAEQFKQREITETVARIISEHHLHPSALELEITEGTLIKDRDRTLVLLRRFKEMGIRLAMDDFGTGYSSLSYLRDFPIDKIKIDRSFVRDVIDDPQAAAIARTIISLAENLGMDVLAEGVETVNQLRFMNKNGCPLIQGYLLGKPVPAKEIPKAVDGNDIKDILS